MEKVERTGDLYIGQETGTRAYGMECQRMQVLHKVYVDSMEKIHNVIIIKVLGRFMNRTSSSCKKLKSTIQVRLYVISRAYTWEEGYKWKHLNTMGGVKEDEDVSAARYCVQTAINC